MFNDSTILITGGTGSWGQTLTRLLLEEYQPKKIIIYSRGELAQVMMQRKFGQKRSQLRYVIGDVRDYEALERATKGVDYIFHLAALKHVPICEENVQEAIKTNIHGTTNIVNAALANNVKKVIDVSTDKAVDPINLYGMTKAVGEKIIIQANDLGDTTFVCIRGGNVMGSNGSVIPYFIEQIKAGGPITITDKRMTRFFLTLEEAIRLLFKASENSVGGETFVMNMPACRIDMLANVLMCHHGEVDIVETGIRQGEKLHEMLISPHDAPKSYCYDDNYFVTLEGSTDWPNGRYSNYNGLEKFPYPEFSSETKLMDYDEIEEMLRKGDFI